MREHTTAAREMSPPLLIIECPGGDGHLWVAVNPRWHSTSYFRPREKHWCPDHEEEKKQHVANAIAEAHKRLERDYQEMPLPATRICMNPNPTKHKVRAVLASGKFYRRSTPHGGRALDSRCKECRKEEAKVRRDSMLEHERRAKQNASSRRHKAKKRHGRQERSFEPDRQVPVEPLSVWVREQNNHFMQRVRDAGIDESVVRRIRDDPSKKTVGLATVDRLAQAVGQPGLVALLYPLDDD